MPNPKKELFSTADVFTIVQWQIQVPIRCENLAGAVEVVLRADPAGRHTLGFILESSDNEFRQLTGCTSPKTIVTFTVVEADGGFDAQWTDVYVLDASGAVLARADLPRLRH